MFRRGRWSWRVSFDFLQDLILKSHPPQQQLQGIELKHTIAYSYKEKVWYCSVTCYTFWYIDQRIFPLWNLGFLRRWLRRLRTMITVFWNENMSPSARCNIPEDGSPLCIASPLSDQIWGPSTHFHHWWNRRVMLTNHLNPFSKLSMYVCSFPQYGTARFDPICGAWALVCPHKLPWTDKSHRRLLTVLKYF